MDTLAINARLLDTLRADDFAGYDPFDLLNSKLLQATPVYRSELVRLAWLQLGKRLPVNLRPLLRVPKMRNPKGIGLVVSGLLEDHARTGDRVFLEEARRLGVWLVEHRSRGAEWSSQSCWGYHFDWQARAFYVPAGKPNVVTTFYVARALYDLGAVTGESSLQDVALDAAGFISARLYTEAAGRSFYAYIPGETAFVHNASLWGSAWCAFAGAKLGDKEMVAQALRVARQSAGEQRADGSWVYGARPHHQFIDGFHTGYNLEALSLMSNVLGTDEFDACIRKGLDYYRRTFFLSDGTAKYYHDNTYPLDMHSFAQAVFTLLKVGGSDDDRRLCDDVIARAIDLMHVPGNGQFLYQRTKWTSNRISYARWTQAWAYYALAYYNGHQQEVASASH